MPYSLPRRSSRRKAIARRASMKARANAVRPVATSFAKALDRIFAGYAGTSFRIRFWDGTEWQSHVDPPTFGVVLRTPGAWSALTSSTDEAALGACYVGGDIAVEGDLFVALRALPKIEQSVAASFSPATRWLQSWTFSILESVRRLMRNGLRHSHGRDAAAISYHYDKPANFYRLWLGQSMVYSCAFFPDVSVDLDTAQCEKMNLICKKLGLKPHDRLLDIGCGWGTLLLHAARHFGVSAHGVSLSKEQINFAEGAIDDAGLSNSCQVYLKDYRELRDVKLKFDKISSVGMCEHVGAQHIESYFADAHQMLVDGGLFLNHGITRSRQSPKKNSSFIDRYVFPDGELLTLSEMISAAESAGFEVRDVEDLREHYEETLHRWVAALKEHKEEVIQATSPETYRVYELYMTGSAEAFRRGEIALHQILLSKNADGRSSAVTIRSEWYRDSPRRADRPL